MCENTYRNCKHASYVHMVTQMYPNEITNGYCLQLYVIGILYVVYFKMLLLRVPQTAQC
jgi:hypothetical protein